MHSVLMIITVAAAIISSAFGVALPVNDFAGQYIGTRQSADSPIAQVVGNFSKLFGQELASYFTDKAQNRAACNNLASIGHHKWSAINLIPSLIQAPICAHATSGPNPGGFKAKAIPLNSGILITQIVNSAVSKQALTYFCNNLNDDLISSFPLNGNAVVEAVCTAAGAAQHPDIAAAPDIAGQAAVTNANNDASKIFANILAAGAATAAQLEARCNNMPQHVQNLNTMGLNGNLVKTTYCSHNQPISADDALTQLAVTSTDYFIIVMRNASKRGNWISELCSNLDVDKMNAVGLVGSIVQAAFCGGS